MELAEMQEEFRLGGEKASAGDWDGAIAHYNRVYEEGSGSAKDSAAFNIGICWSKVGSHEGAMGWLGEFLRSDTGRGAPDRPRGAREVLLRVGRRPGRVGPLRRTRLTSEGAPGALAVEQTFDYGAG